MTRPGAASTAGSANSSPSATKPAGNRTAPHPIRHLDHVTPYRDGGLTTYSNGRGVCERHNYTREMPGWQIELLSNRPHITITTTPTGHSYLSRAPNPP